MRISGTDPHYGIIYCIVKELQPACHHSNIPCIPLYYPNAGTDTLLELVYIYLNYRVQDTSTDAIFLS